MAFPPSGPSDEPNPEEALLADRLADLVERSRRGEPVDLDAIAREDPALAVRLRAYLPTIEAMAGLAAEVPGPVGLPPVQGAAPLTSLGEYDLIREVGRGGMGIVYEALQRSLGRRVALKVLPPGVAGDPRVLRRFQTEAQAAAALQHPHIVPVYTTGCERGTPYYAMQFVEGQDLSRLVGELRGLRSGTLAPEAASDVTRGLSSGAFAPPTPPPVPTAKGRIPVPSPSSGPPPASGSAFYRSVAKLGAQAADALAHAHERDVLHRDIKPANLLLDGKGDVWITDFGLARLRTEGDLTRSGDLLGTLRYMSPEQARARRLSVDERSDVYSLGITLYELMTLVPAFGETDQNELIRRIATEEPTPPRRIAPAIPRELETIIRKATAKDPADRYPTARAFADDLGRFLDGKLILARPVGPVRRALRWSSRTQRINQAGVFTLAYAILMSVWAVFALAFVYGGALPTPARPDEFLRDVLLVSFGEFLPAGIVAVFTIRGRNWAFLWGLVLAIVRLMIQIGCLAGLPPRFGGFYDSPAVRLMVYAGILMLSSSVLTAHLLALPAGVREFSEIRQQRRSKRQTPPPGQVLAANSGEIDRPIADDVIPPPGR